MTKPLPSLFYKYATKDTARIVLESRTLRWSTPVLFNDPYDHQFDLHMDVDMAALKRRALDKVWDALSGDPDYSPHPRNPMGTLIQVARRKGLKLSRERFEASFGPRVVEGYEAGLRSLPELQRQFREVIQTFQVLCLREVRDSLLMWAYYAEQHRGAVLCFRSDAVDDSAWLVARRVQYQRSMPRLCDEEFISDVCAGRAMLDAAALVERVVYTKAAEWAHEKEWRMVAASRGQPRAPCEDVPFHPRELDAVILGCVMPPDDRRSISEIVRGRYPHARLLQAVKDDRAFQLNIVECAH